jgi:hypothetical protein
MIYKAIPSLTQTLLKLPETGMGYQFVVAIQGNAQKYPQKFIIFNAELIVEYDDTFEVKKMELFAEGYSKVLNKSDFVSLTKPVVLSRKKLESVRLVS